MTSAGRWGTLRVMYAWSYGDAYVGVGFARPALQLGEHELDSDPTP